MKISSALIYICMYMYMYMYIYIYIYIYVYIYIYIYVCIYTHIKIMFYALLVLSNYFQCQEYSCCRCGSRSCFKLYTCMSM